LSVSPSKLGVQLHPGAKHIREDALVLTLSDKWKKVRVKVQFTLEETTKAQRGSRYKLYSFFNLGVR
jgi:hypothetical protein